MDHFTSGIENQYYVTLIMKNCYGKRFANVHLKLHLTWHLKPGFTVCALTSSSSIEDDVVQEIVAAQGSLLHTTALSSCCISEAI